MVHVWSFLFFSFGGGRESRGQGQGIAWLPSWMKTLCPCCPRVPVAAVGGDGDGHCHHVSRHWPWSSHTGCTLNWSLLTQGHAEGMLFLLPENVLSCSYLKKILEENRRGLGTYHCRFCSVSVSPKFRKFENPRGGSREGAGT